MTFNGVEIDANSIHCITFTSGCFGMPEQFKYWVSKHPNATILTITQNCERSSFGVSAFRTSVWYKEDKR